MPKMSRDVLALRCGPPADLVIHLAVTGIALRREDQQIARG